MSVLPPSAFHLPNSVPPADVQQRDAAWVDFVDQSNKDVAATAERWRVGLLALLTVTSGALLFKGADEIADLAAGGRPWLLLGNVLVILLLLAGLFVALAASAPVAVMTTREEVEQTYASVRGLQTAAAQVTLERIRIARRLVAAALLLQLLVVVVWLSNTDVSTQVSVVRKVHGVDATWCGGIVGSSSGTVVLDSGAAPRSYRLADLESIKVVDRCP